MTKTIEEIMRENVNTMIPTHWNIYEWTEKHPDTTISHALKRVEKIFDFSDAIQCGFSGGKDSTVSANLACLELNLRKLRARYGVDRYGNERLDPLDAKWANKRIHMAMTDAEVVFSYTNNYAKRFLKHMGPEGHDLIEFNWICLPMAWQSGVSFDSGILISWDKSKKSMWVQPMPTKQDLHGFECLNEDNLNRANPVPLESLSEDAQEYHKKHGNTFYVSVSDLFHPEYWAKKLMNNLPKEDWDHQQVLAVANYGRGPVLQHFRAGCHEKEEQDDYSLWFAQTTWLTTHPDREVIMKELQERYDLKKDIWFLKSGEMYDEGNKSKRTATALISLRAEESLDRRVILSQGEYSTGQYSRNNGVNICSPVFDFTVRDIWRLMSATDWDVNEVYECLYEIGVAPADQRVGSLLNYAAVRQISTVKALEPDLYGRINARFQNVEFMSQFSRAGYYKIGKPRDTFFDGHNHIKAGRSAEEIKELSDKYESILKAYDMKYERYNDNEFRTTDEELKGKPWFPLKMIIKDIEDGKINLKDGFSLDELKSLNVIHITWRDYTLLMLNSTNDPLRTIWREKVVTSLSHWSFNTGSIDEGNLAGVEILAALPDEFTEKVVDDAWSDLDWSKEGRLARSKRMNVFLGHYPQESLSNEANLCMKYIINHWDEYGHLINEIPVLSRIWELAQMSGGKCVLPDEVLTYILEKPVNDKKQAPWIDVAHDIFTNGIPSETYNKYWKSDKIEGYPLAEFIPDTEEKWFERKVLEDGTVEIGNAISFEDQKENFLKVCDIFLKESVSWSPCWKKIAICILKNDVSMKYAGFGATLRERLAREDAIAAFETKKEEKEAAKANAKALAEKIEKENKDKAK